MTPERHAQVKQVFLAAIEMPEGERGPWLEKKCNDDPALRREVDMLLAQQSMGESRAAQGSNASEIRDGIVAFVASGESPASGEGMVDVSQERIPGTMIGGRYRIALRLGAGGMGIVYQADDLTLNQKVAIKFLPRAVAKSPLWLARFRNEARLARTVTHPHVCRVHDIAEADGEYFLTMEFVPGENLAALLRQIGRFPGEKAVEIARQICAGLAAAHRAGVLHRDLKPANIMLDSAGNVRITDFGIAGLSHRIAVGEIRAGTPAYMAPEQIAGRDVTQESDIYALGLVLYELFSGCRGFEATSIEEYQQLHEHSVPRPLCELVSDLPEGVEEVINQCLEKNPDDRPLSALHVLAALPGTDVLRLALAADLTPPPDLVAAAPARKSGTPYRKGITVAALVLLVSVALLRTVYPTQWDNLGASPPAALAERAREVLAAAGLSLAKGHEAFGYCATEEAWWPMVRAFGGAEVGHQVVAVEPAEPCFFFRQSDQPFAPTRTENVFWRAGFVTPDDPPLGEGESRGVLLDRKGRLILLGAAGSPGSGDQAGAQEVGSIRDWTELIRATGVSGEVSDFRTVKDDVAEKDARCRFQQIEQAGPPNSTASLVVGCSSREGPTFLAVGSPASARPQGEAFELVGTLAIQKHFVIYVQRVLFLLLMAVAVPLGIAKLRAKKFDYRGAVRLAGLVALLHVIVATLRLGGAVTIFEGVSQLALAVVRAAGAASLLGVSYLAIDAYARRHWPHLLVTWNRLILGRIRDRDVRFHALVGACVGCWWAFAAAAERTIVGAAGLSVRPMFGGDRMAEKLHGAASGLAGYLGCVEQSLVYGLLFLLLLVVLRTWLRHPVWAGVVCAIILAPIIVPRGANPYTAWVTMGFGGAAVCVWLMVRYGLLAIVVAILVAAILNTTPMNVDARAWTMGLSVSAIFLVLGMIAYGAWGNLSSTSKPRYAVARSR